MAGLRPGPCAPRAPVAPERAVPAALLAALGLTLAVPGPAQEPAEPQAAEAAADSELTLPPVIASQPGQTRLEPPAEDREDVLEAVVTEGQSEWRLPDLGTSLREEEPALAPDQRMSVRFIPLYDPEDEENDPLLDLAPEPDVMRNVRFIEFIELRFGKRRPD